MTITAKDIRLAPIAAADAARIVKKYHYSGKAVNNSQLHLGVFLGGKLEGCLSFGPSLDKRKVQGLVRGTQWNGFIELNRMAFSEQLPRNSESRALSIAFRLIRKHYPHIEWVISFADGTQYGDGTIYRASGFVLTGIKKNTQIWIAPEGSIFSRTSLTDGTGKSEGQKAEKICRASMTKGKHVLSGAGTTGGGASMQKYIAHGFKPLGGYQLRYIYFLNPAARERLTVPVLPFSKIEDVGAGMYKGIARGKQAIDPDQGYSGGAAPTTTLHFDEHGGEGNQCAADEKATAAHSTKSNKGGEHAPQ